ncbi:hypothetical protein [Govanella unica]|uniref:Uncharacterized protein n=1 Tax=Govanella unica TaxID=2975056 RepID=A0A9X3TVD9_9PROT|nr:hypothetical protein [Govania unica]MDA5192461.1 hypothetical protein [Govania unica]
MRTVRHALWLSLLGLCSLSLAACTAPGKPVPSVAKPAAVRPAEPDLLEKSRGPVTSDEAPNASPRLRPNEDERNRRSEPSTPVAVVDKADFSSLIGRSFAGVERLLGPADLTIDVPPGREWHYRDGPCVLVVRFYPDMKTLAYRVLSYAFEGGDASPDAASAESQCRARLSTRMKSERPGTNRNGE